MAVFVSFSDESQGGDFFHHAGLVATVNDWENLFVPAWQRFVLDRRPRIEYLHMTEIRSRAWREARGLSRNEGELRVNAAVNIMKQIKYLFQLCSTVNKSYIPIEPLYFKRHKNAKKNRLGSEHICFLGYVFTVLDTVHRFFPKTEKVDFVVERNKGIFEQVRRLYFEFGDALVSLGRPELKPLFGKIIPGGKDRIPLQAADLLCWYTQRAQLQNLEGLDLVRYQALYWRPGYWHHWTNEEIQEIFAATKKVASL